MKKGRIYCKAIVFALSLLLCGSASAQTVDCYNSTRAQGITLMQQGHYAQAVQVFQSAMSCPDKPKNNDLQARINECRRKIQEIDESRRQRQEEERKAEERRRRENEIAAKGYMEVTGLSFRNGDYERRILTPEGKSLYEDDVRFITPIISYKSLAKEPKEVKLDVKIIDPDGSLLRGDSSPTNYTYEYSFTVSPDGEKAPLRGWGERKGGEYRAGTYSCEIWYNGKRLASQSFTILQKREASYMKDLPLYITDLSFANVEQNGSYINNYNENLYSEDIRFLKGKIKYNANQNIKVPLFVRIFDNVGDLKIGSSSPAGYTFVDTCSLSVGTDRELRFAGWGNNKESTYPPGDYLYEVWLNDVKLFSKTVRILSQGWRKAISAVFEKVMKEDVNGTKYTGETSTSGDKEGWGATLWASGASYWGEYSGGSRVGNGIYITSKPSSNLSNCPDCVYYVGGWSDGDMNGKGTCYDSKGNLIYYGNFANDKPTDPYPSTGYSNYKFVIEDNPDGSYYIGETKDGKRHGMGIFIWKSGKAWFGSWRDGIRNGCGMELQYDGKLTTGKWVGDNYTSD